jgi:hypothetical protein
MRRRSLLPSIQKTGASTVGSGILLLLPSESNTRLPRVGTPRGRAQTQPCLMGVWAVGWRGGRGGRVALAVAVASSAGCMAVLTLMRWSEAWAHATARVNHRRARRVSDRLLALSDEELLRDHRLLSAAALIVEGWRADSAAARIVS